MDIIYDLVSNSRYKIAKVKIGIIHLYCSEISQFVKKQKRRIKDYAYYTKLGLRKFPWNSVKKQGLIKFCIFTLFIVPLIIQAFRGEIKKRDSAWFFHPIACWLTLLIYGYNTLKPKILTVSAESRKDW